MPSWARTLDLSDIFHNEELPFTEKRDQIVRRITASRFYDLDDFELVEIADVLSLAEDPDDFDDTWDRFYDWADVHRVWISTR